MNAATDPDDLEELITEAIYESMDMDWTSRDGARSVVKALKAAGLVVLPDWRPIASAPKKGLFHVTRPDGAQMVFEGSILAMTNSRTPAHLNGNWTHWAPLRPGVTP